MDNDTMLKCPFLPVSDFHDNLVLSSLSNTVGSVVEFTCTGDEILSGPSVLHCKTTGKWNGSVPTCLNENDVATSTGSGITGSSTLEATASPSEIKVETVLIVLWVTGGLLLVTLVILMTCILTSHKKRQRNRSERFSSRGQGNPRHGGVNPTFSNYDEIWTWIPVVTDNADICHNQNGASARENSASPTNRELMRNLRLPSYNEAISTNAQANRSINQRDNLPQTHIINQTQTAAHSNVLRQQQTNLNNTSNRANATGLTNVLRNPASNREIRSRVPADNASRCQIRNDANTNVSSSEDHHYETIPADLNIQSNVRANPANITRVSVTASSGSALQQARDLVNQSGGRAQRPQPSAPQYTLVANESRTTPGENSSREYNRRLAVYTNPSSEQWRGHQVSRAQVQRSRPSHHRSSYDFRHSEASVFEYYGEGGLRGRPNIPSATFNDPPPPYSIVRGQSPHRRDTTAGVTASVHTATTSLHTGLESHYF